ncbi:MAG: alpha/beta fold hydrolase [Candidatus Eremiobacterota bacterium]
MIPDEAKQFEEKNLKYAKIIQESMTAKREDMDKRIKELNLAATPKETVYEESSLKLYRYTPVKEQLHDTPLLIIPSLILRYYIMDLIKSHSLIENLVGNGIDTYLLDWGIPGDEHGHLTFDYYIDTFMRRAVRKVSRLTGKKKINMLGQCLGGTLACVYTSLYEEQINKLVCLTTPVDFQDAGILALWTRKEHMNIDKVVDSFGSTIPADFIHSCFQFLDVKATVERYKKLYNNVLDDNFLFYYKALDQWINDKIPFPAQVFRKFIGELYQENLLSKGDFKINGKAAELKNITCPVLNIVAEFDHVFPEKSAKAINSLVGGPVDYHVISAGHVTLVALFPQREETFRLISTFLTH